VNVAAARDGVGSSHTLLLHLSQQPTERIEGKPLGWWRSLSLTGSLLMAPHILKAHVNHSSDFTFNFATAWFPPVSGKGPDGLVVRVVECTVLFPL
jgi:hypothetical protein